MIKERPILFSTDVVQAMLDGRKSQTRRILKPQPTNPPDIRIAEDHTGIIWREKYQAQLESLIETSMWTYLCPYGKPGDILWVRESWKPVGWDEGAYWQIMYKSGDQMEVPCLFADDLGGDKEMDFWVKCCDILEKNNCPWKGPHDDSGYYTNIDKHMPWRTSIHIPKNASRIWLRVINVRVERLQEITNMDAKAEGIQEAAPHRHGSEGLAENMVPGESDVADPYADKHNTGHNDCLIHPFKNLWQKINGNWNDNPWVWVVEFEVLSTNGKPEVNGNVSQKA